MCKDYKWPLNSTWKRKIKKGNKWLLVLQTSFPMLLFISPCDSPLLKGERLNQTPTYKPMLALIGNQIQTTNDWFKRVECDGFIVVFLQIPKYSFRDSYEAFYYSYMN